MRGLAQSPTSGGFLLRMPIQAVVSVSVSSPHNCTVHLHGFTGCFLRMVFGHIIDCKMVASKNRMIPQNGLPQVPYESDARFPRTVSSTIC